MIECYECGEEIDEEDVMYECPFCGEYDMAEGYYECPNCGALMDCAGDEWECEYCENEGEDKNMTSESIPRETYFVCPSCGEALEDEYEVCDCGWPDVNQGWVGEHYS